MVAGRKVDWGPIEREYIRGRMTLEKLAEKYQISESMIQKASSRRNWTEKRRNYAENVQEKALARAQARDARTIETLCDGISRAARELKAAAGDIDTLHGRVISDGDGGVTEVRTRKLDTKALRDLTAAMRELAAAMTMIRGAKTEAGQEAQEERGVIVLAARADDPQADHTGGNVGE